MTPAFLTVDPGKWHAAAAVTVDNHVVAVTDIKASQKENPCLAVREVANGLVQWSGRILQLYGYLPAVVRLEEPSADWNDYEDRGKAGKKDIPYLMLMNGAISARLTYPVELLPVGTWKGSIPKKVHHRWIWKRLDEEEKALFGRVKLDADGYPTRINRDKLDAVGMGLWCAKRIA